MCHKATVDRKNQRSTGGCQVGSHGGRQGAPWPSSSCSDGAGSETDSLKWDT